MDNGLVPAATGLALAAALLETGDPSSPRAVELLLERYGGAGLPLMPGASFRAKWLELLTRCWLALGRPDDARRAAACAQATAASTGALRMATRDGRPRRGSRRARIRRRRLGGRGRWPPPPPRTTSAFRSRPRSRARSPGGRSRRPADRAGGAELERAAAAFHACGARRYRDAADHELRRLGVASTGAHRPARPARSGSRALTEREREVARLVVDRRTNSEIAEILFLSPKTVETHMRNIFRKLDVSSRAEAARTVEAEATRS